MAKPLKIVHFNHHAVGGSAVLMRRLHLALLDSGVDSHVRHRSGVFDAPQAMALDFRRHSTDGLVERLNYSFENRIRRSSAGSYFSRSKTFHPTRMLNSDLDADVVHLHWIGRWLDLRTFVRSIPLFTAIVWTIHDMSPLAGGCFSDINCNQLESGCKRCPLIRFPADYILARRELQRRQKAISESRIAVVANSSYTQKMVKKSLVFRNRVSLDTIHPGIDVEQYESVEKREAKRALGIPENQFVIGFGAASLTDEIKGCERFLAMVNSLRKRIGNLHVLLFGEGEPSVQSDVPVTRLGLLKSCSQQSQAYSAMDAFVVASSMETFGQVASEAQACGTPVYAFKVGGLVDAVSPGESGGLVPFGECEEMASLIARDHESGTLLSMSKQCRDWVSTRFGLAESVSKYMAIYQSMTRQQSHRDGVSDDRQRT